MNWLVPCVSYSLIFIGNFVSPASALDLNSFRAEHKLPPLVLFRHARGRGL